MDLKLSMPYYNNTKKVWYGCNRNTFFHSPLRGQFVTPSLLLLPIRPKSMNTITHTIRYDTITGTSSVALIENKCYIDGLFVPIVLVIYFTQPTVLLEHIKTHLERNISIHLAQVSMLTMLQ